jgi:hypothetical protein
MANEALKERVKLLLIPELAKIAHDIYPHSAQTNAAAEGMALAFNRLINATVDMAVKELPNVK